MYRSTPRGRMASGQKAVVGDDPFVGAGDPKYAVMPGAEYAEAFVGDQDFAAIGPLRTVAFHGRHGRIGDSIVGSLMSPIEYVR